MRRWAVATLTGDPRAALVTDATLDFLDQYLHGASDGIGRLQARVDAPGVAKLEQEREE